VDRKKSPPDGPGHRNQLHPTQRNPQKREAASDPFDWHGHDTQRDHGRQHYQEERDGGDPDNGQRRK
jgi:hypothetical protein